MQEPQIAFCELKVGPKHERKTARLVFLGKALLRGTVDTDWYWKNDRATLNAMIDKEDDFAILKFDDGEYQSCFQPEIKDPAPGAQLQAIGCPRATQRDRFDSNGLDWICFLLQALSIWKIRRKNKFGSL